MRLLKGHIHEKGLVASSALEPLYGIIHYDLAGIALNHSQRFPIAMKIVRIQMRGASVA